ncbi:D-glycero-alpha-D-manno-heptose-1,7-bisphosphate 7-phosphatase [Marinifilum sp.]|uniref:D-glycero-alpha-D-manno-heptose-1,7-bisphosphate 7-phosphatase n=1 Tax=Marinifilum sp. TaxID=2033137 RepID=UPI003BAA3E82
MKRALFLDRDGVINKEYNYVHRIEDFDFIPGIFDFCKLFLERDYIIIIITNQAGIARKYYSVNDFNSLTNWMLGEFGREGVNIAKVYHCPHHPDYTGDCKCRKPNPGMILEAKSEFDIDIENSILIGDKISDIESGINAGIRVNNCYLFNGDFNYIINDIV